MGWILAAAIVALIVSLFFLKVSVRVIVGGDMKLTLGVWIFRFLLYPTKEKTVKLSDYKIKKFRKNKEKLPLHRFCFRHGKACAFARNTFPLL